MPTAAKVRFFKDPMSAATHFGGFLAAIVGLVVLIAESAHDAPKLVSMAIYGATLVALFAASSIYHFFDLGEAGNKWLRRMDHVGIFLLIAGSYVPSLVHLLEGNWRIGMLVGTGVLTVLGIAFKLLWVDCPTWLSAGIYLVLGWSVLVPAHLILPQLSMVELGWLVAGGLAYSGGAVIYVAKRPDPWPGVFGHHEVWHLFVLAGAALHFGFMVQLMDFVVPPF
jgi:hemolysin III